MVGLRDVKRIVEAYVVAHKSEARMTQWLGYSSLVLSPSLLKRVKVSLTWQSNAAIRYWYYGKTRRVYFKQMEVVPLRKPEMG